MRHIVLTALFLFAGSAFAQNLKCGITYRGNTKPMFWFAQNGSHHSDASQDPFSAMIEEKSTPGKIVLTIMDAVDDATWEKFAEITDKADLSPEQKKQIRELGRTRITKVYLGLYGGILHYEHRLGNDPNVYEISCTRLGN